MAPQAGDQGNAQPTIVQVLPQTLPGPGRWQPIIGSETLALSRDMRPESRGTIVQEAVNVL